MHEVRCTAWKDKLERTRVDQLSSEERALLWSHIQTCRHCFDLYTHKLVKERCKERCSATVATPARSGLLALAGRPFFHPLVLRLWKPGWPRAGVIAGLTGAIIIVILASSRVYVRFLHSAPLESLKGKRTIAPALLPVGLSSPTSSTRNKGSASSRRRFARLRRTGD